MAFTSFSESMPWFTQWRCTTSARLNSGSDVSVGAEAAVVHGERAAARETVAAENLQALGHELQLHSPLVLERNDARIFGLLVAHKQFGLNPVSVERPQKPVGSPRRPRQPFLMY